MHHLKRKNNPKVWTRFSHHGISGWKKTCLTLFSLCILCFLICLLAVTEQQLGNLKKSSWKSPVSFQQLGQCRLLLNCADLTPLNGRFNTAQNKISRTENHRVMRSASHANGKRIGRTERKSFSVARLNSLYRIQLLHLGSSRDYTTDGDGGNQLRERARARERDNLDKRNGKGTKIGSKSFHEQID